MAGIYIHIPFCKTRCIYCDFFSSTLINKKTQYIEALCKESELRKDYLQGEEIQTIYFGGGTPSLLSKEDFEKIFTFLPLPLSLSLPLPLNPLKGTLASEKTGNNYGLSDIKVPFRGFRGSYGLSDIKVPFRGFRGNYGLLHAKVPFRGFRGVSEISLEVNPDDITPQYLESLKDLPFNRISIGVQSFNDSELCFLNRRHNAQKAIEAVKTCRDYGFTNISIDLMYGLPGQTMQIWKDNLRQALELEIQHISAYHLIYEKETVLFNLLEQGKIVSIDEALSVDMFSEMIDMLEANGFEHYEISNFAKPGFISLHNSSYWDGTHYLGIGAAAHSFNGKARHRNIPDLDKYIQSINQGNLSLETEIIGEKEAYNDFVLTRMRAMKGMNLNELETLFGAEKKMYCLQQGQKYIQNQTIQLENNFLKLMRKGIFISDGIMSDLFL